MRKVKCVETKKIFENAEECAKWLDVSPISIRSCCNGTIEKIKGLTFEYVVIQKPKTKKIKQETLFKEEYTNPPKVEEAKEEKCVEEIILNELTSDDFKNKKWGSVIYSKMNEIIRYVKKGDSK